MRSFIALWWVDVAWVSAECVEMMSPIPEFELRSQSTVSLMP